MRQPLEDGNYRLRLVALRYFYVFEFGLFVALVGGLLGIGLSRAGVKRRFPALADYHLDVVAVVVLVIGLVLTAAEHYRSESALRESERKIRTLDEKQRPRVITPTQRSQFVAFLAPLPKGKVSLKALASDNEAKAYADSLEGMLKEAGCEVVGPTLGFIVTGAPVSGIELKIKDKGNQPIHAGNLQKAFENIGIKAPCSIEAPNDSLPNDTVVIYVYGKN